MRRSAALVSIPLVVACVGAVGDPEPGVPDETRDRAPEGAGGQGAAAVGLSPQAAGGTGGSAAGAAARTCTGARRPGGSVLRRLTATEYTNTVRDLLGVTSSPGQAFPIEGKGASFDFDNAADGQIASDLLSETLIRASEELSATVKLDKLAACLAATAIDDACASRFIADFGKRAYRRPLQTWETAQLQALYQKWKSSYGDAKLAVRLLLQVFLQSPQLLYRLELMTPNEGAKGSAVALSPYEVATRLSYFLWASMPDAALFAAADAGQLSTPEQVATQARRMLAHERAKAMLSDFHWQWLELEGLAKTQASLDKDSALYKEFGSTIQGAMVSELELVVQAAFDGGTLDDLIRSPRTFLSAPLATYYGLAPAGVALSATAFTKVELDPARAVGVLTQGGLLAKHAGSQETSPIRRGNLIRKRFLCQHLEPPEDPAIDTNPRPRRPGTTVRQWLTEAHSAASPACRACHALIDPVGLGFERFDAVGRWRDTEILPNDKLQILPANKKAPVSDAGDLTDAGEISGPFQGVRGLGDRLARSPQVRDCVVRQWFRYAHGRPESDQEECAVADLTQALDRSGGNLRELLIAITRSDAFLYRPSMTP